MHSVSFTHDQKIITWYSQSQTVLHFLQIKNYHVVRLAMY